ncbi:MAG: cytochrome b/b6 domain-containing protein [Methylobacteriaceae bacterium]|nr:cytochrome b/b6 domain-containing protein [Methylobacteriaceae bacterium]
MSSREYLLPLWLRLWHWTNAVLMIVLAVTGASLHFADPELKLVPFSLATTIHEIAGIALAVTYAFFVVANIVSGNWWQYVPKPPGVLHRCWVQTRYYMWGIFRGEPHPYPPTKEVNFNALQAVVYWTIMYVAVPVVILTGLVFFYPTWAPERMFGLDGLLPIAMLHYVAGAAVILFMVAHIYLGTMGVRPTSLFRMMITGWHEH